MVAHLNHTDTFSSFCCKLHNNANSLCVFCKRKPKVNCLPAFTDLILLLCLINCRFIIYYYYYYYYYCNLYLITAVTVTADLSEIVY